MKHLILTLLISLVLIATPVISSAQNGIVNVLIAENSSGGSYEGQFDSLIAAVNKVGQNLVDTLNSADPLTLFAPTDEAFEQLGLTPQLISRLPPQFIEPLAAILLYHATPQEFASADIIPRSLRVLEMADGSQAIIGTNKMSETFINQAPIVDFDIMADNGYIHVISAVLIPLSLIPAEPPQPSVGTR